ncbi:shikimate dehydrogenase family protein [Cesiribacter andamanensis]|uniref:Shikimate dehydrogenase n=1 Tax=Cesiribacter andamanensis AMV16 TaxID=1279009 RepID=M7N6I6_9BACT|nr:shikimate dehydrogenase [Cesiribacter andamanensis]EMR02831.1 Shikimate dehydrogenase [Cesiribacter andamanensis AMV16]
MRQFGLIGYPLGHSFSRTYFTEKFGREGIADAAYALYPISSLDQLPALLQAQPSLAGLNVTIPYKEKVIPYLDQLHESARKVGAVNVIRIEKGVLTGYNSDYFGFKQSLLEWMGQEALAGKKALVLGTGGASKAVCAALTDLQIPYRLVSRQPASQQLSYAQLHQQPELLQEYRLIINTTPLGMHPQPMAAPDLPYHVIGSGHYLYDLVYNPAQTVFMQAGSQRGAATKGGLQMLQLQAERAWEIWNS